MSAEIRLRCSIVTVSLNDISTVVVQLIRFFIPDVSAPFLVGFSGIQPRTGYKEIAIIILVSFQSDRVLFVLRSPTGHLKSGCQIRDRFLRNNIVDIII